MTEPYITAERAVELIRWWATRLGLENWEIGVRADGEGLDQQSGQARISQQYDSATLVFSPTAPHHVTAHPHAVEITVVHEMLHLVTRAAHDEVWRLLKAHVPKPIGKVGWQRYNDLHENAIERLARSLVSTRHGLPDEMPVPVIEEDAA